MGVPVIDTKGYWGPQKESVIMKPKKALKITRNDTKIASDNTRNVIGDYKNFFPMNGTSGVYTDQLKNASGLDPSVFEVGSKSVNKDNENYNYEDNPLFNPDGMNKDYYYQNPIVK